MRTTISALAVAAAACGGDLGDGGEADSSLLALGRTPGGALYHAANCLPQDERARLVTFAPGTGLTPDHYQLFVEHLGNASGLCVVAVQYENTRLAAACCTTTETPDGLQDPDCLLRLLSAKSASEPERMTCTDGSLLSVPSARSVEGAILEALDHLGMTAYLTEDGNEVLWDRLVLTGHSQGAQLSKFIALTRHAVAGVGSIAGGVLPIEGQREFPDFVYEERVTEPALFKAFHHLDDADSFRREVYDAIGIPSSQVRTSDDPSSDCTENPHSCVIVDRAMPMEGGVPAFLNDWEWLVSPAGRPGPRSLRGLATLFLKTRGYLTAPFVFPVATL